MKIIHRLWLSGALALSGSAFAQTHEGLDKDPILRSQDAILLQVTDQGFSKAASIIYEQVLAKVHDMVIPPIETRIPLIADIDIKGVTIDADFDDLALIPRKNVLRAYTRIDRMTVLIGSFSVRNPLFPEIKTVCKNTEIRIGGDRSVPIDARIKMGLDKKGAVKLELKALDFKLGHDQLAAKEPTSCTGPFQIDLPLMRSIVKAVVLAARPFVGNAVKGKMKEVVSELQGKINRMAQSGFEIDVPKIAVIPAQKILLGAKPTKLSLSDKGLDIAVSTFIADASYKIDEKGHKDRADLLARLSIKYELLNQVFAVVFKKGSVPFEVTPELHEMVAAILKKSEMAAFWPDLEQVETTSDDMRLFAQFNKGPVLTPTPDKHQIAIALPDAELRFMVQKQLQWQNYFGVHLNVNTALDVQLENSAIRLKILPTEVLVKGRWYPEYTPQDPTFHSEEFGYVVNGLVQLLSEGDGFQFQLPTLPGQAETIHFDNLLMDQNYIAVDAVNIE